MNFEERLKWLESRHEALITRKNEPMDGNGVYERNAFAAVVERPAHPVYVAVLLEQFGCIDFPGAVGRCVSS